MITVADEAAKSEVKIDLASETAFLTLVFSDRDVVRVLEEIPPDDRTDFALRAFKIGLLAIRDAGVVGKADYVEKEFERLKTAMEQRLENLLGEDGELERALESAVGEDGTFKKTLEDFLGENGRLEQELQRTFGEDGGRLSRVLNPHDESSPLGKLKKSLEERFDPDREQSALWKLKEEIREHFQQIKERLGIAEAVAEERGKGTQKGFDFEDHVLDLLDNIAEPFGDRVEHVGKEEGPLGDVGDILCHLAEADTGGLTRKIVCEVKDRGVTLEGKTSIYKELSEAMENRQAQFAIAAVDSERAARFAPLRYAAPDQILVSVDKTADDSLPLVIAYRVARILVSAEAAHHEAGIEPAVIEASLTSICRQLENVRAMKTHLTGAGNEIETVRGLLDGMKKSILETVTDLQSTLQASTAE